MLVIADNAGRGQHVVVRRVAIVVFDRVQSLDVTGPAEVLARAGELGGDRYDIQLVSSDGENVRAAPSGIAIGVDSAIGRVRGDLDLLLVAGGDGTPAAVADRVLIGGVRRLAKPARRVASVCTGAFVLAEAGILDGRRATTHWGYIDDLARRYPTVDVDGDRIYVRDGDVWTSAGVTAGMDLALALVEADLGRDVALATARRLVMYLQRPGGQSQFSVMLDAQASREPLRDVQAWVATNLRSDLSVASLAKRAMMSPRNFARAFDREVGVSPGRYVESLRVDAARRLLETTSLGVDEVAATCGFGSAETMRRAFVRQLRVAPSDYRKRFQKENA